MRNNHNKKEKIKGGGDLIDISNIKSIANFIQQPAVKIGEALTGILASDFSELKFAAGRVLQGAIKYKLLTQLGKELKEFAEKGKIKGDYFATNREQASLIELLKFIDGEIPDEEVFKAMKSIFFTGILKGIIEKDRLCTYEFLQIGKQLKSGDVLILKACYELRKEYQNRQGEIHSDVVWWIKRVSEKTNLPDELVEFHELNLNKLKLLMDRRFSDKSGIVQPYNFSLTSFGIKFCEFITNYP